MAETLNCRECNRPLQKDRESCIYCGHELTAQEKNKLSKKLNEEAVKKQLDKAEAILEAKIPTQMSSRGKIIGKTVVTVLALGLMFFISLVSEWNPIVTAVVVAFFSFPIWQVFRRL